MASRDRTRVLTVRYFAGGWKEDARVVSGLDEKIAECWKAFSLSKGRFLSGRKALGDVKFSGISV